MPDLQNVSPLVVLWILTAAMGFRYARTLTIRSQSSLAWLREKGLNGAREVVARANIRSGFFRLFVQGVFVLVGTLVLLRDVFPRAVFLASMTRSLSQTLFMCIGLATTFSCYMDLYEQDRMKRASDKDIEHQEELARQTRIYETTLKERVVRPLVEPRDEVRDE